MLRHGMSAEQNNATSAPSSVGLVRALNRAVRFAFESTAIYRILYGSCPIIRSIEDFWQLPVLTEVTMREHANGLLDCLSSKAFSGDDGILDVTTPLDKKRQGFPFSVAENNHDFQRRYARVHGILTYAGVNDNDRLLIVCDCDNIYFASDLEDVLTKWSVTIIVRDQLPAPQLAQRANQAAPDCIILATRRSFGAEIIPASCRIVVTFMGRHEFPSETKYQTTDVCTESFFPWLAARRVNEEFYLTNEIYSGGIACPQVYIESAGNQRVNLTNLFPNREKPLMPLIRYAASGRGCRVVGDRFLPPEGS